MTQPDKLTIEDLEKLRDGLFKQGGIVYVPENFNEYPDIVKMLQVCGLITRQLLDTMRENERLRDALDKKGCVACDPAKYYAVMGDPRVGVTISADHPNKHTDDDSPQARRIKRKLERSKTSDIGKDKP